MKIAVFGAGGVGGYFGARLAVSGADVTFIARGRHLAAMRADGLRVLSQRGDVHLARVSATDDARVLANADLVMLAVKLWDTDAAVNTLQEVLRPSTAVVSFQNGIDAVDILTARLGPDRVFGGLAHIAALIERPGVIRHNGTMARLTFGELNGRSSTRTAALLAAAQKAGIDAELSPQIQRARWEKFIFIVGLSAATAVTRLPIGRVRADPDSRALLLEVMREAAAVGRARGMPLDVDAADRQLTFIDTLPGDMIASMLGDLQRGQRLELPWLSGAVVRLGNELAVATPANRFVCAALKLYADGATRSS